MVIYVVEIENDTDITALPGVYAFENPLKGAQLAVRTLNRICDNATAKRSVMSPSGGFSSVSVPKFDSRVISSYLKEVDLMTVLLLIMKTQEERTYTIKIYKTYLD